MNRMLVAALMVVACKQDNGAAKKQTAAPTPTDQSDPN